MAGRVKDNAILMLDPTGMVMTWNDDARRLHGYEAHEIIGRSIKFFYPSEDEAAGKPRKLLGQAQRDGRSEDEGWRVRKDGSRFLAEVAITRVTDFDGNLLGFVKVTRDVTEQRRAEAHLARNLATSTALGNILRLPLEDLPLESILEGALAQLLPLPELNIEERGAIFLYDQAGGVLRLAASRNFDSRVVESCSRITLGQCLCGEAAATRSVVFASSSDPRHTALFEGMTEHGHYCVPLGRGNDLVGVLTVHVAPTHGRDAQEEGFLLMVADTLAGIVMRKRTEQTLRESEEITKALLNATSDAAFMLDRQGRLLTANETLALRMGRKVDDMIGKSYFEMHPPALAEARTAAFRQVLAEAKPLHTHDEGEAHVYDNRTYPICDASGRVAQVAVFSRDITFQRLAQRTIEKALADLARSNEELEQFAYVASHDLRQPLRMISGYLDIIHQKIFDTLDDEMKEFFGYVMSGARRMDALILGLLEYSRVGRMEIAEPVPLAAAADEAIQNLAIAIEEAQARVTVADGLPTVSGNRMELMRLFQNLIGNAIKYRGDRIPEVSVGWREHEGEWEIFVADNGIGIRADARERIFGIFQRLVSQQQYEGTGIGLAVCKKIVEQHGGRIRVDSEVGRGSTFIVTLPKG
jgi:PAS domain S-box-containing protein